MRSVAFFRNLNQGQRRSPTSQVLGRAFAAAGASEIVLFQSNGTVVFSAEDADSCAQEVAKRIQLVSEWQDVVFVRSLPWLRELLAGIDLATVEVGRAELSLFDESCALPSTVSRVERRCTIVSAGDGFAVCLNERVAESNGTPTLERMLGVTVTSRGLPTLRRLVDQEGSRRDDGAPVAFPVP